MRHLPFDIADLRTAISSHSPKWLDEASKDTATNRDAQGHVASGDGRWSAIKPVFRKHQREKCAFCERTLGEGAVEWDVEHYRPKGRVDDWVSHEFPRLATGGGDPRGYFLLAHEPRNYLACCKTCNTTYKRNIFPVAGRRDVFAKNSDDARAERPFLLNPLDPADPPPEKLIGYHGVLPQVAADTKEERQRAYITIEVLGLGAREDLARARAETIVSLRALLDKWNDLDNRERTFGRKGVESMTAPGARMSACALAFRGLYERDPERAKWLSELAQKYVESHSR